MIANNNTTIRNLFNNNTLIFLLGLVVVLSYLIPLFKTPLYISVFDNLDSTIPLLKILAHSGKIFADNNNIIPNMMNGLPRSTYGSEYNVMLWLYYFFEPKTAYIINQITLHIVAYVSMYTLLKKYITNNNTIESYTVLLTASLYFALLPFFSPEGLSIPLLPLVTFSLLNIKYRKDRIWDWLLLITAPLYTNFIFVYMFYILLAGIYGIIESIRHKQIQYRYFMALFIMGIFYLLVEYRLVLSTITSSFISHRTEFNFFFTSTIMDAYRGAHIFFLNGHHQHLVDLQSFYVLPVILIGLLLSLSKRKFTQIESMIIWILIVISFAVDIWGPLLAHLYTLPILTIFILLVYLFTRYSKIIPLLFLLQLALASVLFITSCKCMHFLLDYLPILKMLNVSRIAFIQPLIWAVLLAMTLRIYSQRLHYFLPFILLFMVLQIQLGFNTKEYFNKPQKGYATFSSYYAPTLFKEIKKKLKDGKNKVVHFGLQPAVSLFNDLYTVDGYTTNYPLSYKNKFKKVISQYLKLEENKISFERWGSKLYLMQIRGTPDIYEAVKGTVIEKTLFDVNALCNLGTKYIISSYEINITNRRDLILEGIFKDNESLWDIYLYKIQCTETDKDPLNHQ